jgi:hypothetical protein
MSLEEQWREQEEFFLRQLRRELSYEECWARHLEIIDRYHEDEEAQDTEQEGEDVTDHTIVGENLLEDEAVDDDILEITRQISPELEESSEVEIVAE